jgi:hypothetical protein
MTKVLLINGHGDEQDLAEHLLALGRDDGALQRVAHVIRSSRSPDRPSRVLRLAVVMIELDANRRWWLHPVPPWPSSRRPWLIAHAEAAEVLDQRDDLVLCVLRKCSGGP